MNKIFSFLKKSNRNKNLIGGLLVGLYALSPWAAIYPGQGTGPCPDEQQGAAYIGTLTFPQSLQMRVKSTEGGHMPSYLSILKNSSSI